ncbi:MAG TPA: hypothetical protein VN888_16325 [Mycobacterium sp.]|nr:hypothetical protein [Mycobacterium sp.]
MAFEMRLRTPTFLHRAAIDAGHPQSCAFQRALVVGVRSVSVMQWCQAGIATTRVDLENRLTLYRMNAFNENAGEYLQRQAQKSLITLLIEVVQAIIKHAPDDARTLPEGLIDTLAKMDEDDAPPRTHAAQLGAITTAVQNLLEKLEPDAPVLPAPE